MKDKLNADLKTAMLARDGFLTDVLKGLKASIMNQEIAEKKREKGLSDAEIQTLFAKEAKKRLEAAAMYVQGKNQAMADKERRESDVIKAYLPEQLSQAQITKLVEEAIKTTGATSPQDMGKVIGLVKSKAGSAADGATVAQVAKKQLEQRKKE